MWSLIPRQHQVWIVVATGAFFAWSLSAIISWLTGTQPPLHQVISLAVTAILLLLVPIVERVWKLLWRRFPVLNRLFFPDLNGTWIGELRSTWIDAEGKGIAPIPVTAWIRQGWFSVSVTMQTSQSTSNSVRCLLEYDRTASVARVWYVYDNRPAAEFRQTSPRHDGTAWLEMSTDVGVGRLRGQYFTERLTSGDMELTRTSYDARRTGPAS